MDEKKKSMRKRLSLPSMKQVGIVTKDLDNTMRYFRETLGIRPWFIPKFSGLEHYRRGKTRIEFGVRLAFAYSGNIQIEIIEPGKGDDNTYSDHLKKYGEGIHHLGFYVGDLKKRLSALKAAGVEIEQSGVIKSGGKVGGSATRYAYLDTRKTGGVIFELIQTDFLGMHIGMSRFWFELGAITGDLVKLRD